MHIGAASTGDVDWAGGRADRAAARGLVDSAPNFGWTQGEFSVSDDGAAQYSVPLRVPAGRGAVTPQLSLSYSSRAGNGLLGVGWSLGGLSQISWCGRTIAQDGYTDGGHFDGTGALCLNGSRLVPVSPQWQLTTTTVAGGGKTAELVDQLGRTRERRVTVFDG